MSFTGNSCQKEFLKTNYKQRPAIKKGTLFCSRSLYTSLKTKQNKTKSSTPSQTGLSLHIFQIHYRIILKKKKYLLNVIMVLKSKTTLWLYHFMFYNLTDNCNSVISNQREQHTPAKTRFLKNKVLDSNSNSILTSKSFNLLKLQFSHLQKSKWLVINAIPMK